MSPEITLDRYRFNSLERPFRYETTLLPDLQRLVAICKRLLTIYKALLTQICEGLPGFCKRAYSQQLSLGASRFMTCPAENAHAVSRRKRQALA